MDAEGFRDFLDKTPRRLLNQWMEDQRKRASQILRYYGRRFSNMDMAAPDLDYLIVGETMARILAGHTGYEWLPGQGPEELFQRCMFRTASWLNSTTRRDRLTFIGHTSD